ncbi:MAG: hypothetical protein J6M91_06815, partial [Methanobrevibacter sp.]|nr:hypothetical protein [Methanobrevibacter sp.]
DEYNVTVISKEYPNNSNSTTLTVNKGSATVSVSVEDVVYPGEVNVIVESPIDDTYTVMVNTTSVSVEVKNGRGNKTIKLDAGSYNANVAYDNANYDLTINNDDFTVNQGEIELKIDIHNVNPSVNVTGTVYASVDGNYNVTIGNNKAISVAVNGGSGTFDAGKFLIGEYDATVEFAGNTNYKANSNSTSFNVSLDVTEFTVEASPSVIDYAESVEIIYSLPEGVTGTIEFTYNNKTEKINVGEKLILNDLDAGNYTIMAKYSGNSPNATAQTTLTVNPIKKTAKVTVNNVTYPSEATVIVEADVDGLYTVDINGNKVSVNVVGGKGNATITLSAGDYDTSSSFGDTNYDVDITEDEFSVGKAANNAELVIASETELPEKVVVSVSNAAPGKYTVSFNDSSIASVELTVGDSGSASKEVAVPAGQYKATLSYSDDNYADVNNDVTFKVLEKQEEEQSSDVFKIRDSAYPSQSVIMFDDQGVALIQYRLDVTNFNGLITIYCNDVEVWNSSATTIVDGGQYTGIGGQFSLSPGTWKFYAKYTSEGFSILAPAYDETSNSITYVVSGEPVVAHETNIRIYEDITEKT